MDPQESSSATQEVIDRFRKVLGGARPGEETRLKLRDILLCIVQQVKSVDSLFAEFGALEGSKDRDFDWEVFLQWLCGGTSANLAQPTTRATTATETTATATAAAATTATPTTPDGLPSPPQPPPAPAPARRVRKAAAPTGDPVIDAVKTLVARLAGKPVTTAGSSPTVVVKALCPPRPSGAPART